MPDTDPPVRLNAPLVRALMWGAGMEHSQALAAVIGVHPSNLSRALRGEQAPSARMLDGIARRWPLVPYARLFVRPDEVEPPQAYGLTAEDVAP